MNYCKNLAGKWVRRWSLIFCTIEQVKFKTRGIKTNGRGQQLDPHAKDTHRRGYTEKRIWQ